MAHIDFLTERFAEAADGAAVVWRDEVYSYAWLLERIRFWQQRIREEEIGSGCVVALEGDFSPNTISLLLALIETESITVPTVKSTQSRREQQFEIARVQAIIRVDGDDEVSIARGPSSRPPWIWPRSAILQRAAASSVD